jgi:hypothetical protein
MGVGTGSQKRDIIWAALPGCLAKIVQQFLFGERAGKVQLALQPEFFGDLGEEIFNGSVPGSREQGRSVGGRTGQVAH